MFIEIENRLFSSAGGSESEQSGAERGLDSAGGNRGERLLSLSRTLIRVIDACRF